MTEATLQVGQVVRGEHPTPDWRREGGFKTRTDEVRGELCCKSAEERGAQQAEKLMQRTCVEEARVTGAQRAGCGIEARQQSRDSEESAWVLQRSERSSIWLRENKKERGGDAQTWSDYGNKKITVATKWKRPGRKATSVGRNKVRGFPGGAVVKNLPANAGDTGWSPGLGRSHMPRSN